MRFFVAFLSVLLAARNCPAGAKKEPEVTIRFYGEVASENGKTFATEVPLIDGTKNIWISKIPTVSEKEVTSFLPFQNADGSIGAYFFLDDHGRLLLETLSIENRGKTIVCVVNGRHIVDLLIDKRVSDGIAVIPTGLTPQELDLLRKKIKIREAKKAAAPPGNIP